jgi:UDP-N-acetyl-D-glucosamine dehydrogenase
MPSDAERLHERLGDRSARVVVLGQGYVGLPLAMRAAEVGFPVIGFDVASERVEALRSGVSSIEDVSSVAVTTALAAGYLPSDDVTDLSGFDVAVITVPTPLREGAPDLSFVTAAARVLVPALRAGALVILESTTYPGTTTELLIPVLEESGLLAGGDFFVGYSPERTDPGNPTWGFVTTPKVVSGIDAPSAELVAQFYGILVDTVVPVASTAEAELVKLLENTFRHVNIALVNEFAMFARELGVNIWSAIDAASTKPYGFMRFTPGPGVGGHCLPIDPSYLSWQVKRRLGQPFRFVELANDVNEHMPDYVVTRIIAMLNRRGRAVLGTKILLLGLAYKAGTSDFRESPSLAVAERLVLLGAQLQACDPHVLTVSGDELDMPVVPFGPKALAGNDLVVVLVDHPDFDAETIAKHAPLVFDAKAVLAGRSFEGEVL